ncbi:hypothetical protein ACTQZS_14140 [Bilifractor sp. LCP19S3_H10]|uniref:hypothetical protein n=1 Tax=Bilifractor sp. LCP19S3_H10 TaxID=3438736 RepID=UPI003F91183B
MVITGTTIAIEAGKTAVKAGKKVMDEVEHASEEAASGKGKNAGEEATQEVERMANQAVSLGTKATSHIVSGWGDSSVSKENDEEVEV